MGRTASSIELSIEDRKYLESQMRARTIQAQTAERARILILKADGKPIDDIAALIGMNRKSVMLCLKKYKEGGVENALFDAPGRGRNAEKKTVNWQFQTPDARIKLKSPYPKWV